MLLKFLETHTKTSKRLSKMPQTLNTTLLWLFLEDCKKLSKKITYGLKKYSNNIIKAQCINYHYLST